MKVNFLQNMQFLASAGRISVTISKEASDGGRPTLLETCHQVFFRITLDFSMENEGLLPKCQFKMEKKIIFTRAFFAFGGFF